MMRRKQMLGAAKDFYGKFILRDLTRFSSFCFQVYVVLNKLYKLKHFLIESIDFEAR